MDKKWLVSGLMVVLLGSTAFGGGQVAEQLLEKARQKAGVDHDPGAAIDLYRQVIEQHRSDVKHSLPALRELLHLWTQVAGDAKLSGKVGELAKKYLEKVPARISEVSDETLKRDLLLKPWTCTISVKDKPVLEVFQQLRDVQGVRLSFPDQNEAEEIPWSKVAKYDELPEAERKAVMDKIERMLAKEPSMRQMGTAESIIRQAQKQWKKMTPEEMAQNEKYQEESIVRSWEFARKKVTLDFKDAAVGKVLAEIARQTDCGYGPSGGEYRVYLRYGDQANQPVVEPEFIHKRFTLKGAQFSREGYNVNGKIIPQWRFQVQGEPGMVLTAQRLKSLRITDALGAEIKNSVDSAGEVILLPDLPKELKSFKRVEGVVEVSVAAGFKEIRLPLDVPNATVETSGGKLTLVKVEERPKDGRLNISLSLEHKDDGEKGSEASSSASASSARADDDGGPGYLLELADGTRMKFGGMGSSSDGETTEITLRGGLGAGKPAAVLIREVSEEIVETIPFVLENVTIP